jgi:thioredoxin-related protein
MRLLFINFLILLTFTGVAQTIELAHGLKAFTDYEDGISYAKKNSKSVLLYFNSKLSASCRKFEKNILSDPKVQNEINQGFVVVNLYVDDKTPPSKKLVLENGKPARTIGEYNVGIENKFKKDYQPYIMVLNKEVKPLKGSDYTSDPGEFIKYLRSNKS